LLADIINTSPENFEFIADELGWNDCEEIIVNLAGSNHLLTWIAFEFNAGETTEMEAVLDTGSEVSFLNRQVLLKCAPKLLNELKPCPIKFTGIGGKAFPISGLIALTCRIEHKICYQYFVVADIGENVLLGLDFMDRYKVNWDWLRGRVKFDKNLLSTPSNHCVLAETEELPPRSLKRIKVNFVGSHSQTEVVMVEKVMTNHLLNDIFVSDGIGEIKDGQMYIEVGNSSDVNIQLMEGCVLGEWTNADSLEIKMMIDDQEEVLFTETMQINYSCTECENPQDQEEGNDSCTLPKELQKLQDDCRGYLSPIEMEQIKQLLFDFKDTFELEGEPLGRTSLVRHKIDVGDAKPIKQQARRVPIHQEDIVESEITKMLNRGVVTAFRITLG